MSPLMISCKMGLIEMSKENYESARAISEVFNSIRIRMMIRVFDDIKAHIQKSIDSLKPSENYDHSYQQDSQYYYVKRRGKNPFPGLIYPIKTHEGFTISLLFEVGNSNWGFYYGLVFYKEDYMQYPGEIEKLTDAFSNEPWKALIDKLARKKSERNWWLWWRRLPKEDETIDFQSEKKLYSELYDSERYKEIMEKIYVEIDENLDSILKTGLPCYPNDNIETY